ncbi:hypothetical protein ABZ646_41490, partial [Streptomyces sp. NPDC007162]
MTDEPRAPFLYLVVCAAGVAAGVGRLITAALDRGWEAGVVAVRPPLLGPETVEGGGEFGGV